MPADASAAAAASPNTTILRPSVVRLVFFSSPDASDATPASPIWQQVRLSAVRLLFFVSPDASDAAPLGPIPLLSRGWYEELLTSSVVRLVFCSRPNTSD